ncbi:MAG: hypothetical protein Q9225_001423, partial [Loekoesia sp. 1 TL-2023]
MELDEQDCLPQDLHEPFERSISKTENQTLYAKEPQELPDRQTEDTLNNGAAPLSDEEAMETGAADQPLTHAAGIEDWPLLALGLPEPPSGNHGSASIPDTFQNPSDSSDTFASHDIIQLHASTSLLEVNHGADLAEQNISGNVPLAPLPWDGSFEIIEADLEGDVETDLNQPYPQLPSWVLNLGIPASSFAGGFFSSYDEIRNMSFVECLRFSRDGYALQQRTIPNHSGLYPGHFAPLTDSGIYKGMESRMNNKVTKSQVNRQKCDPQGLDWNEFGVSRLAARNIRLETYINHANCFPPYPFARVFNRWPLFCSATYMNREARKGANIVPNTEEYFHFSRTNLEHRLSVPHNQLRHIVSASSKNAVFFPTVIKDDKGKDTSGSLITCFNPDIKDDALVIDSTNINPHPDIPPMQKIYTLTAKNDILIAGGLHGEYAMKSLSSPPCSLFVSGLVTHHENTSTNHVHTFLDRRSGLPQAAFSSNDCHIRVLDCTTNTFLSHHDHSKQVNCAATSPDTRLRVLVRDAKHPLLVEADTGKRIGKLSGHSDFGFACDWSDDGIHFATGAQDGLVNIFDARQWRKPMRTLTAELGGVRSLAFSPAGSGNPVLVMAESADFVHVVDAVRFDRKQTIDFFGEIAGVSFEGEGERFWVGVGDPD